jgi:transposase
MSRTRRIFTKDFKLSILAELKSGKNLSQLARENEVHPSLISRWKKEYEEDPDLAFAGQGNVWKEEARIAELERKIGQLYLENEFLKKVLKTMEKHNQEEKKKARQR